jgi:hypothetical protein
MQAGVHFIRFHIDTKGEYMGFGVVAADYAFDNLEGKFLDKRGAWSVGTWKGLRDRNELSRNGVKTVEGDVLVDIEQGEEVLMEVDMDRRVVSFHRTGHSSVSMPGLPAEVLGVVVLYAKKCQVSVVHSTDGPRGAKS